MAQEILRGLGRKASKQQIKKTVLIQSDSAQRNILLLEDRSWDQ